MDSSTRSPGNKKCPELLAPAGSMAAFFAAVAAGADAVYLSGKQFGARKFAQNFSEEEIAEAVAYAHARGVRVYVTVNTLVHDRELPGVAGYLVRLYAMGVDAMLVQDPGIAALAREIVPGLALHASTQLTIHNAEGVRWAHGQGFSRVVLARELSLAEVESIARATADTGTGLEVFLHGALCYSYSGQCLLSSVIGGRSGNRGMCAQPCRKKYTLVAADADKYGRPTGRHDMPFQDQYLLSPKDLCTFREIPRLANAPVASLKIEGRMKSPEYVAIVVSTYRRALDAVAAGTFIPDETAVRDLTLSFNRGFTRGYLFGDHGGKLMGRDRPDNRGLCIGTVMHCDARNLTATVHLEQPVLLHPGDGLLFSHPDHPSAEWGYALNSEPERQKEGITLVVPRPVQEEARVFLTASVNLAARARQISRQGTTGLRQPVPVDIAAAVSPEGLLTLAGTLYPPGKDPVAVEKAGDLRLVPARSHPLTREQLAIQLEKTGGTSFTVAHLALDYAGDLFSPVSGINRARREFFTRAEEVLVAASRPLPQDVKAAEQRLAGFVAHHPSVIPSPSPKTPPSPRRGMSVCLYADDLKSVEAGARAGAETICFEPRVSPHPDEGSAEAENARMVSECRAALDICRAHNVRLIWKLPRITRQAEIDAIRLLLPRLHAAGLGACMAENPGTAVAVAGAVPGLALAGSWGLNIFNAETVRAFAHLRFKVLMLSPELSANEITGLIRAAQIPGPWPELGVFVQGNLETMVTEDCLLSLESRCRPGAGSCTKEEWYGIRDETGRLFPVRTDGACRTHIFNASETCLVDAVPDLVQNGVDMIAIDARWRTAAYAGEMVRIYRDAIGIASQNPDSINHDYAALKDRIKAIALGGITAGHYTRGLKED